MDVHLFATDESALLLADAMPQNDQVTALIIPQNRAHTNKVKRLAERSRWPVFLHVRQTELSRDMPPAEAGLSWLYSQIINASDLNRYPRGILNMHGGRIPEYRGANVLQWAIIQGEHQLGITWHEMAVEVDAGPIWHESAIPIPEGATGSEMRAAMLKAGLETFPRAWGNFREHKGDPRRPDFDRGRVWPARKASDGRIEFGLTRRQVTDLVRALLHDWPPATILIDGTIREIQAVADVEQSGSIPYRCADGVDVFLVPADQ